ncbi:hypothetical protein ACF08M_33305 [Streptomyces sp. NPDC015032]|uniref:hypothetical protein n=1 Tax=Streptomyces sp. NPDC015032 TaxID=3364937 RepID=UPI0036FFBB9B
MHSTLPPIGGTVQPHFIYTRPEEGRNRFVVHGRAAHWGSDRHLGFVSETAGGGWLADWSKSADQSEIAMPGFQSKEDVASALFWFKPPARSDLSAQWYRPKDQWVNATVTVRAETEEAAR